MRAEAFKAAVLGDLAYAKGTYVYDAIVRDLVEKTSEGDPCGYWSWLDGLFIYLVQAYGLSNCKIMDLGCGSGGLTVVMNLLGYEATGVDVDEAQLAYARLLARDNGIPAERFVLCKGSHLPFDDSSFDVITMFSCLEHMDDATLTSLLPELRRISRGVIFVQVPSPMKVTDDHTGLRFVPWMPRWLAQLYISLRGARYRYVISQSKTWDVEYRTLRQIQRRFEGFKMDLVPPEHSFPQCRDSDAVMDLKKEIHLSSFRIKIRIPLIHRRLAVRWGERIQHFYPYYNLAFRKESDRE